MIPVRLQGLLGLGVLAAVWWLLAGCESIDPAAQGPELSGDAVLLSCEGCHTNRVFLRRIAVPEEEESGGGG